MAKKKRWNYMKKKRDKSSWSMKQKENSKQIKNSRTKLRANQLVGR
ncbi:hypothetical protein JZO86_15365 [Enterococcus ureasiticus]|nr:hypothetical protein [Enterococcus ureasiticus]MBO0475080.1 hypothetical protein [Enterococcus ureasiticus]